MRKFKFLEKPQECQSEYNGATSEFLIDLYNYQKEGVEKRKSMNYFQDYFLQNHATIPYSPNEKVNYYSR